MLGLNQVDLGKYESNEMSNIKFTVTMPAELGNEYAAINSSIKWKFGVKYEDKVVPKKEEPKVPSPQTGDVKVKIAIGIFVIAAISLIVVLVLEKKKKNK